MSRRYNVNMAENYSYFSNFEGKYLRNYLKLVHKTLSSYYGNRLFNTVLFRRDMSHSFLLLPSELPGRLKWTTNRF